MIPRTVKAAAAVQSTFTTNQYLDYGNIILNGYQTTASAVATAGTVGAINTLTLSSGGTNYTNGTYTNVYLGGYPEGSWGTATVVVAGGIVTTVTVTSGGQNYTVGQVLTLGGIPRTAPGTAATVTVATVNTVSYQPVLKGWTTNYSSYYTELAPASPYSNTYPGCDAGGFEYIVHSFKPPTGAISALGFEGPMGYGYTDGVYTNVATNGAPYGSGATLNIVVASGQVQSVTINNPGSGYSFAAGLTVPTYTSYVTAISLTTSGAGYTPDVLVANRATTTLTGTGTGLRVSFSTNSFGNVLGASISSVTPVSAGGSGYNVGDTVQINGGTAVVTVTAVSPAGAVRSVIGPGTGFMAIVMGLSGVSQNGNSYWSQRPINGQAAVNSLFPLPGVGGWIYPVADNPVAPPIDTL